MTGQGETFATGSCWFSLIQNRFAGAGMRATGPRKMIALSVFAGNRERHFTAQEIHRDLTRAGSRLSLATVYNTLNGFSDARMLRKIPVGDGNFFFDTNKSDHVHLVTENEDGVHIISDADDLEGAIAELRRLARDRDDTKVIRIII
jgi:Fe2+ or Zn2+ uptake regulation protein